MLFEQLLLQPLRKIELLDPWPDDITGAAGSSLLAGAIVLHFDQTAVVCTSPLRYMQSQSGTLLAVPGVDCMASLGYRITLKIRRERGGELRRVLKIFGRQRLKLIRLQKALKQLVG